MELESEQIANCPCRSVYESFVNTIHDFGIEQVVKETTRGKNILDLFLINQPSLVHSTQLIPPLGTGDHDIVYHELKVNIGRRQQKQRHQAVQEERQPSLGNPSIKRLMNKKETDTPS